MTDPVFECPEHGYATAPECPDCGRTAREVLSGDRRRRLSKSVSGALRHFPADAGLELDDRGWTDYGDLADAVARKYEWAGALAAVVATDPKGRFETRDTPTGPEIRAAYGHSVDVDLERDEADNSVPDRLYHGTDPANLDAIRSEGLRPMGRQEVHLSATPDEASEVGRRHASEATVLEIDAAAMNDDGLRVTERGERTYTADAVPPEYLTVLDS
ncbi:RNA 2'-phosphotransferase [Halobacteriales archaeon QS_1_67_19]|nr:MAG: RNA 2'-phosphotransferase [Halobacteriales archaeon QS_1_67_19]